jgi:predicted Zn-dependent protease
MEPEVLAARLRDATPAGVEHAALRWVDERTELLTVRRGVVEPPHRQRDVGAIVTVIDGGVGYAATPDVSVAGLAEAVRRAREVARATAGRLGYDAKLSSRLVGRGAWRSPEQVPWGALPLGERLARLLAVDATLAIDPAVVDWTTSVMAIETDVVQVSTDGGELVQALRHLSPEIEVVAHRGGVTQRRTLGGLRGASRQGGAEVLAAFGFESQGARVAHEAVALLEAPECPSGVTELVLAPDQMMLQIHESIGHPLELDRILGDERNYAGRSFVTPEMFGTYQYGSPLLDVSFDPTVGGEFASYGFDDEGTPAERVMLIAGGLLLRPLGGGLSQARSGLAGTANARASSWNRAPIDRMANLNVEPGETDLASLIGGIERGVWMETNLSWSIDDSRNKFQFGCELGREIVDGQLGRIVRNPCYRGISATFWRSLSAVGDRSTVQVWGTPYCGKGEPNQLIRVGHASPVCRFSGVDVFGGAA